jgi:hypothetical protein
MLITTDFLQEIVTTGWKVGFGEQVECVDGLPPSAKFVRSYYDPLRQCMVLVFEHESFDAKLWLCVRH